MDPMAAIQAIPGVGPYIPWLTLAITVASALCAVMPAPKTTSGVYYVIYQAVNTLAANFGHAKNLSAPESTGIVGGAGAISAPLVSTSSVELATATTAQKASTVVPSS